VTQPRQKTLRNAIVFKIYSHLQALNSKKIYVGKGYPVEEDRNYRMNYLSD
jgi:hypothetical protein